MATLETQADLLPVRTTLDGTEIIPVVVGGVAMQTTSDGILGDEAAHAAAHADMADPPVTESGIPAALAEAGVATTINVSSGLTKSSAGSTLTLGMLPAAGMVATIAATSTITALGSGGTALPLNLGIALSPRIFNFILNLGAAVSAAPGNNLVLDIALNNSVEVPTSGVGQVFIRQNSTGAILGMGNFSIVNSTTLRIDTNNVTIPASTPCTFFIVTGYN